MPTSVGNGFGSVEEVSSGRRYNKYVQGVLIALGTLALVFATFTFAPVLTKGKFQNPISRYFFGELGDASKTSQKNEVPRPTIDPLPQGVQSWNFSHGSEVAGPRIQTVTFSTLDPGKTGTQAVTLTIKNDSPVTKATATLFTDNTRTEHALKLSKGTDTDGTWVGSWKIDDTYMYIYHVDFLLESSSGNWSGGLTF